MPLFEYECRGCGRHFEHLARAGETPSCPACSSVDLQKLLSVFAVGGAPEKAFEMPSSGACGHCGDPRGPGSCAVH
jgi:putative FmdB family regulatory protein